MLSVHHRRYTSHIAPRAMDQIFVEIIMARRPPSLICEAGHPVTSCMFY